MSLTPEAAYPSPLCFVSIYRKCIIIPSAGMSHMICTTADRAIVPGVDYIENKWHVCSKCWMKSGWRTKGAISNTSNVFTFDHRFTKGYRHSVTSDYKTGRVKISDLHFQPFHGRINKSSGTSRSSL